MNRYITTIGVPVMPKREHYTKLCIESLLNQNFDRKFEIVLAQHPDYHYDIPFSIPENISINQVNSGKSLSSKRNDILKFANGDYILFVDDDIIAEKNWLSKMTTTAEKYNSDIFWGTTKPIYEKELPNNLLLFEMYIGGFHYNSFGKLCRKGLIGCNFGVKKNINHKRNQFIESLGRGASIRGGEEVMFLKEYQGDKVRFERNAIVHHHIQKHRINFKYIIHNQFNNVLSQVYINKITGVKNIGLFKDVSVVFIKSFIPRKYYLKHIILSSSRLIAFLKGIMKFIFFDKKLIK